MIQASLPIATIVSVQGTGQPLQRRSAVTVVLESTSQADTVTSVDAKTAGLGRIRISLVQCFVRTVLLESSSIPREQIATRCAKTV